MRHPLADIRVLNLYPGLAAAYCTRLLGDLGCNIVNVNADDKRWSTGSTHFDIDDVPEVGAYLQSGQCRLSADEVPPLSHVTSGVDLVVESGGLTAGEIADLRRQFPQIVVVSIRPFGVHGPWADRPASDFTIQALSGSTFYRGSAAREPLHAGGRLTELLSGAYAAVAAVAALARVRRGQAGEHVDLSIAEVAFIALNAFQSVSTSMAGPDQAPPVRSTMIPGIQASSDGLVGFTLVTPDQFGAFLEMIGRPELSALPGITHPYRREAHREVLEQASGAWTQARTTAEVMRACSERGIPVAPVNSVADLASSEHYVARKLFVPGPNGHPVPRPPFIFDHEVLDRPGAAAEIAPRLKPAGSPDSAIRITEPSELPLTGVVVVDLTAYWAGPCTTQLFSALGATVIKVESHQRFDGNRGVTTRDRTIPQWWEWSAMYQSVNTDKLGITLDIRRPEGRALFDRLLADADILIENGTPKVLAKLGIDWDELHRQYPRLTLLRMPGFGLHGPWAEMELRAYDPTISEASGVASLTGYAGEPPVVPLGFCDCVSGVHAALAGMAALAETAASGVGHLVESAMCDVLVGFLGPEIASHDAGRPRKHLTNRNRDIAPQGMYRCSGADSWIAIAIHTDDQWRSLVSLFDSPILGESRFDTNEGRQVGHDVIDAELAEICSRSDAEALAQTLRDAGIPAERVLTPSEAIESPQFTSRGFAEEIPHPVIGPHKFPSMPFRFASNGMRPWFRRASPQLGQHNSDVLGGMLGLDAGQLEALNEQGVIGNRP